MKISVKHEIKKGRKIAPQEIIDLLIQSRKIDDMKHFLHPPSPLNFSLKDFGFSKKVIHHAMSLLEKMGKDKKILVNLSGRGDKDIDFVADKLGL